MIDKVQLDLRITVGDVPPTVIFFMFKQYIYYRLQPWISVLKISETFLQDIDSKAFT